MSGKSHELLTKTLRAVPERSKDELEEIIGKIFVKYGDGKVTDFQSKEASGVMSRRMKQLTRRMKRIR